MARLAYNLNAKLSDPNHFHIEPKPEFADDESDSILDDRILERPPSGTSPQDMSQRRESLTENASIVSPRDHRWSDFAFSADSTAHSQSSNMTSPLFFEQGGHAFVPDDSVTGQMYSHPSTAWQLQSDQDSSFTPTTTYDAFPADSDVKGMVPSYHNESLNAQLQGMYGGLPVAQPAQFYGASVVSTSPRSGQDWSSISSAEHMDLRTMGRTGTQSSPTYGHNPPLLRRDGIRKKNARFEIPAERTLRTIDQLINQTTDEAEIKELKQQKRLLRNRQAALDSRQRKKQHTERLEEEKKNTTNLISELEEALGEFRMREEAWLHEKDQLLMGLQQQRQYIDELMADKEEIVRRHTIESTELRRKNAYLAEHAQKADSIAMSAVPSSTGYSAEYSDFDNLTMESSPWDNFSLVTDFNMEPERKAEHSFVAAPKKERTVEKESDTSTAPGLLLMLLLCGAWVVSNNSSVKSGPVSRMPEDVRVASTAVLKTIYSGTGLQPQPTHSPSRSGNALVKLESTGQPLQNPMSSSDAAHDSGSSLATLHRQLISPSEQQQRDRIFSLSAEQYNGLTADDGASRSTPVGLNSHRNLGDALAALRLNKQGSAAEAYTRSLMWDEIPGNIVRDFARMVAEARQESQEPLG
ncbi:MAG: hypothetical protein Q9181_002644 [Wetmoreana brouardii]